MNTLNSLKKEAELHKKPNIQEIEASDSAFFKKFREPFATDEKKPVSNNESLFTYNDSSNKNILKIFIIIFLSFSVILFFLISQLYETNKKKHSIENKNNNNNSKKAEEKIISNINYENIEDIIKVDSQSNIKTLSNHAKILEVNGNLLKSLKIRLEIINQYIQLNNFQAAQIEALKINNVINKKFKNNKTKIIDEVRINLYNLLSEIYYRLNIPQDASIWSDKALDYSLNYFGKDSLEVAKQYELMAFHLDNIGDFEQSLRLRFNSIKIRLKADDGKIDEGKLIADMNNLGEDYRTLQYLDKSKEILIDAINRIEEKHGIDAPELIVVLNNLGLTHQANNEKILALSYLQQSFKLSERHYGNNHKLTQLLSKNISNLRGFRL